MWFHWGSSCFSFKTHNMQSLWWGKPFHCPLSSITFLPQQFWLLERTLSISQAWNCGNFGPVPNSTQAPCFFQASASPVASLLSVCAFHCPRHTQTLQNPEHKKQDNAKRNLPFWCQPTHIKQIQWAYHLLRMCLAATLRTELRSLRIHFPTITSCNCICLLKGTVLLPCTHLQREVVLLPACHPS